MTKTEILRQAIQTMFPPKYGSLSRAAKKAGIRSGTLSNALRSPSGPSVGMCVRLAKAWGMGWREILTLLGIQPCLRCCGTGREWSMEGEKSDCLICDGKSWVSISEKDID